MIAHGWVVPSEPHVTRIELETHALALVVGERVIIESRDGDVAQGDVVAPGVVTCAGGFGIGRRVRVRRPR